MQPLTIESVRQLDIKSRSTILLGKIAAFAFQRRFSQLSTHPMGYPTGLVDKALMKYLKQRAIQVGDVQFLDRLHKDYWQGTGGQVFSAKCDHRFEDLFLGKQGKDFHTLQNLWDRSSMDQIVEFGCNSGLLLNYFTQQLASVQTAMGIELNQHQVDENLASNAFDPHINTN